MENRFPVMNRFFSGLSRRRAERARRRERSPSGNLCSSDPSVKGGRACRVAQRLRPNTSSGAIPPRSLHHGHDPPSRQAASSRHQPIRYEGFGPHTYRARPRRTKGPARLPAAGNRCCEEDRKVFPQTAHPDLREDLVHNTGLQASQGDPKGHLAFAVEDAPFTVARGGIVRCRGWLYRQGQGQPGLLGRGLSSRPFSRP